MKRITVTLEGYVHEIPEDYEDFVEWAGSHGVSPYSKENGVRGVACGGDVKIWPEHKYWVDLDEGGGPILLTEQDARLANLQPLLIPKTQSPGNTFNKSMKVKLQAHQMTYEIQTYLLRLHQLGVLTDKTLKKLLNK